MSTTSPSMSLTLWTSLSDPYSNTQLAGNFSLIDAHNHETGKGLPIGTNGLQNHAINFEKISPGAIQGGITGNILAGSITAYDIANGTIGTEQLSTSVFGAVNPIGTVIPWFRPNKTIPIPHYWRLADGSTLTENEHSFPGGGSITLPDLRNKFVLGADPNATGNNGPTEAPGELATGGSHIQNLNHNHTINPHSHEYNHAHGVQNHGHAIQVDGTHAHTFAGGNIIQNRKNAFLGGISIRDIFNNERANTLESAYVTNIIGEPSINAPMDGAGAHSHGGSTALSGELATTFQSANVTSSLGLTSNEPSPLPSDFRPSFTGLIYLIHVGGP